MAGNKSSLAAYALWLLGGCGWAGWHHVYLGRGASAFLHAVTFNLWGVGALRDLLCIPRFVAEANANDEFVEQLQVKQKYHPASSTSKWMMGVLMYSGCFFGFIASCLLPQEVPPVVHEVLYAIGAGLGVYFTGVALDITCDSSLSYAVYAPLLVVLPSYLLIAGDDKELYAQLKLLAAAAAAGAVCWFKRWADAFDVIKSDPSLAECHQKIVRARPSFPRALVTYVALLSVFTAAAGTGLAFHGKVTVDVNGQKQTFSFYEAVENAIKSEAFADLKGTLSDMYYGTYSGNHERWKQFKRKMDVSGEMRYLQILELEEGATAQEIKAAYRRMALRWHPDKYDGSDRDHAQRMFYQVQEAYEKLSAMPPKHNARTNSGRFTDEL